MNTNTIIGGKCEKSVRRNWRNIYDLDEKRTKSERKAIVFKNLLKIRLYDILGTLSEECTLGVFPAPAFVADFPPAAPEFHHRTHRVRLRNLGTTDKKSSHKIRYRKIPREHTVFKFVTISFIAWISNGICLSFAFEYSNFPCQHRKNHLCR